MITSFYIQLLSNQYDKCTGWQCAALAIPSARVKKLIVGGRELSPNDYDIDGSYIRLKGSQQNTPVPDSAVLLAIEKKLIRVDTAIIAAVIGMIATLGASLLSRGNPQTSGCPACVCPTLVCPTPANQAQPPQEAPGESVLPESGKVPSLLQAFQNGRRQEFAGEGTIKRPTCRFLGRILAITIPSGYKGYAGCYVDVEKPKDLTTFLNGVIRVELTKKTERLEIKIEAGPDGQGRQETYLLDSKADAGLHVYPLNMANPAILKHARRLTIAISGDSSEGNIVKVHP